LFLKQYIHKLNMDIGLIHTQEIIESHSETTIQITAAALSKENTIFDHPTLVYTSVLSSEYCLSEHKRIYLPAVWFVPVTFPHLRAPSALLVSVTQQVATWSRTEYRAPIGSLWSRPLLCNETSVVLSSPGKRDCCLRCS
jgi:hypothetical protein